MRRWGKTCLMVGWLVLFLVPGGLRADPRADLDAFFARRSDIPDNISRWSGKTDRVWILREWIKITTERNEDYRTAQAILAALGKPPSSPAPTPAPTPGPQPGGEPGGEPGGDPGDNPPGGEPPATPSGKPQDGFPPEPGPGTANGPGTAVIEGEAYDTLGINGSPSDRPADRHPDLNLSILGWSRTDSTRGLIDMGGDTDGNAPKLKTLFADGRVPEFPALYRVNGWDWDGMRRKGPLTDWEVTLAGMTTSPGEILRLPSSGYQIGDGKMALVLYAAPGRITLKYTREDNVVSGYTLHVEGVAVEGRLLALYEACVRDGRGKMPALRGGQGFGRAAGGEIQVAIRDTGMFMDPRVRKDWW